MKQLHYSVLYTKGKGNKSRYNTRTGLRNVLSWQHPSVVAAPTVALRHQAVTRSRTQVLLSPADIFTVPRFRAL